MKYIVKVRKIITQEYELEVNVDSAHNAIEAMTLAESTTLCMPIPNNVLTHETKWTAVSINYKNSK